MLWSITSSDDVVPPRADWAGSVLEVPERFAGWLHRYFPAIDDHLFRWGLCLAVLVVTLLLRTVLARILFKQFKRFTTGHSHDVNHQILTALTRPFAAALLVCGIFAALGMLKLPPEGEAAVAAGARVAFIGVLLWGSLLVGNEGLDHAARLANQRGMGVGVFMPLIKKILGFVFIVFSVLVIARELGAHVETFLAGLGIGGLAVALAAQDTIANMFGSFVVVMDHPFHVGDAVKIGGNEGTVEDIGIRSTRLRTGARTLIVIPNKTVASEAITNLSRMPQRRVDQSLGLTYDTTADQMEELLTDLRQLLKTDPGVHPALIAVHFTNYGESTLDIQIVYFTADPDWLKHLEVRERINLKIMRMVAAKGLQFAFPTQTVIHQNPANGSVT